MNDELENNGIIVAIQKDIGFIKGQGEEIKKSFEALRKEFSDYLDKEAERWQKWGEVKSRTEEAHLRIDGVVRDIENNKKVCDTHLSKEKFNEHQEVCESHLTKEEFAPVRGIVYGLVALTLTTVFGAVLYLVIK